MSEETALLKCAEASLVLIIGKMENKNCLKSLGGVMIKVLLLGHLKEKQMLLTEVCAFQSCFSTNILYSTAASTTPATSTTCTATVPPQPQYSYHDINVYSLGGLAPHITLNPTVSFRADLVC